MIKCNLLHYNCEATCFIWTHTVPVSNLYRLDFVFLTIRMLFEMVCAHKTEYKMYWRVVLKGYRVKELKGGGETSIDQEWSSGKQHDKTPPLLRVEWKSFATFISLSSFSYFFMHSWSIIFKFLASELLQQGLQSTWVGILSTKSMPKLQKKKKKSIYRGIAEERQAVWDAD